MFKDFQNLQELCNFFIYIFDPSIFKVQFKNTKKNRQMTVDVDEYEIKDDDT